MGFKSTIIEKPVLVAQNSTMILWIYVDDLLIFIKDRKRGLQVLKELKRHFDMKIIGDAQYVLKISIIHDHARRTIWLHQRRHLDILLDEFGGDGRTSSVPMSIDLNDLINDKSPLTMNPYRRLLGILLHIANVSRPNNHIQLAFLPVLPMRRKRYNGSVCNRSFYIYDTPVIWPFASVVPKTDLHCPASPTQMPTGQLTLWTASLNLAIPCSSIMVLSRGYPRNNQLRLNPRVKLN